MLVYISNKFYMADFEVNKRLKYLITEVFKVTPHKFSIKYMDKGGVKTSQVIRERNGLSNKMLEDILDAYPQINKTWLLTGEGNPLKSDTFKPSIVSDVQQNYLKGVPYYEDLDVTASLVTSFSDYKENPTFYINYRHFNDCDAYLPVMGNSMSPLYCNGDIVAIRKIRNIDTLLPGETYLVITSPEANSLRTIKCVFNSPDKSKIILRAVNPDYSGDTEIFKKDILSIYFVKGKITRNEL